MTAVSPERGLGDYYKHARTEVIGLLPKNLRKIADVGGSSGATLSAIRKVRPGLETVVLDAHAPAIKLAQANGHAGIVCNLEHQIPDVLSTCDTILLLDVLEHLVDPWSVLRQIVQTAPKGATVIVSLPNVRYWEASWNLFFRGRWRLQDAGILDRTHLRFFTAESSSELLSQAGLNIRLATARLPSGRRYALLNMATLGLMRDFLAIQFIFVATK